MAKEIMFGNTRHFWSDHVIVSMFTLYDSYLSPYPSDNVIVVVIHDLVSS